MATRKPQKPQNKPKVPRRKNGTFRKGHSGNPGGRPLAERELAEAIQRRGDELVAALLRSALAKKPNVKAIAEALNRGYGKAKQVVELAGPGGGPLRIDLKSLSKEDLDALEAIVARAASAAG